MFKTAGYILFLLSCLSFLLILIVPWIGLTKIQIAGITTGLIITGEISFYVSLIILGRSFWDKLKSKFKLGKSKTSEPDGLKKENDPGNI